MTTTTTQTRLIATEGILRPRPLLRTGFAQHVAADPNYSIPDAWSQDFEEPSEPKRIDWEMIRLGLYAIGTGALFVGAVCVIFGLAGMVVPL